MFKFAIALAIIAMSLASRQHLAKAADVVSPANPEAYSPANPEAFLFRVACPDDVYVAQWLAVPFGPSKYYYRSATSLQNIDCSIYDYDPKTDASLPRRDCGDPGGLVRGFPIFLIPLGFVHCR